MTLLLSSENAACLMVQGCTSDAGKSLLVAGLCRVFARQGHSVAPFKPQNMALNSAVTEDGGEIGRAQALQAIAAGVTASVHMNPVLLKPNSDTGAQVIIQGHSIGNLDALDYHQYKPTAAKAVFDSFQILKNRHDLVLVEGAGSPAEVNLRQGDIANMGFAEPADCPVILVADIDRGGVFAHIIGTLACLSESEKDRIKGFVINQFRGDLALLQDGLDWLEAQTGKPVLGVLPYLHDLQLDAEDAIQESNVLDDSKKECLLKVIVPLLPHISNHTDFDPLRLHPQIDFKYIKHNQPIPPADLMILPGSKNVGFDLNWLINQGWQPAIEHHLRYGGKVIGICGGLQMLGQAIFDPDHLESDKAVYQGLGLLDYQTTLSPEKQLKNRSGTLNLPPYPKVQGYEIHAGITDGLSEKSAVRFDDGQMDGTLSDDGQILVTYLHGLFDTSEALNALLQWAGHAEFALTETVDLYQHRETQLNRLADAIEQHLEIEALANILHPSLVDFYS